MSISLRKVGIVGVGHVGAHCAFSLATQGIVDELTLVDKVEQKAVSERQDLVDSLVAAGMPKRAVHLMQTSEVVAAASKSVRMLDEGKLTHKPNESLDASALGATKRKVGGDGYGFGGDSCPIESAAAATWAVMTTRRDPKRKMRVL